MEKMFELIDLFVMAQAVLLRRLRKKSAAHQIW